MSPSPNPQTADGSSGHRPRRHWFDTAEGSDSVGLSQRDVSSRLANEAQDIMDAQAGRPARYGADIRPGAEQPTQVKKSDGAALQYRDGLVSSSIRADARIDYEYERDERGVKHDAQGTAIVKSIHISDGGRQLTLDRTNCPNLQERVRVAQSGQRAGDIEVKSDDGSITTIITTDQSIYRTGMFRGSDGKPQSHVLSIEKNDASGAHGVSFVYDQQQPDRLKGVVERTASGGISSWQFSKDASGNDFTRLVQQDIGETTRRYEYASPSSKKYSVMTESTPQADGSVHTDTWRRVGDSEKFRITKWNGSEEVCDMTPKRKSEHRSHIIFENLKRHWFDSDDQSVGKSSLENSRQMFLEAARRNHLFSGVQREVVRFIKQFEGGIKKDRNDRVAAPTDDQIARSYNYLCRMLGYEINHGKLDTEHRLRHKTAIGERHKRLACETALMALGDPLRFVNQADKGTCTMNGVQSLVIHDNPEQYCRIVNSCLDGRVVSRDHKNGINLNKAQITPEYRNGETFANQLFTAAAVTITNYKLYTDTGDSFPGAGDKEAKQVWRFATGKDSLFIAGQGTPAHKVRDWIKRHGGVLYYCPDKPHCESIIGMTRDGRFIRNNSWLTNPIVNRDGSINTNQPLSPEDGVYSARQLGFT